MNAIAEARAAIAGNYPTVLKFDGLAAGEGVAVCPDEASTEEFLNEVLVDRNFGDGRLLVEELLLGIGSQKLASKGLQPKTFQTPCGPARIARHVYQSAQGGV